MRSIRSWHTAIVVLSTLVAPATACLGEIDWDEARQFWAFQAPEASAPPAVANSSWVRRELDRFILHRLEREGLAPAPEASRETLVRRLSLDLTGLPPSVADHEIPQFYSRFVDHLLDTPQFGERMASLWLPVARYAEDQAHGRVTSFPGAPHYRSWVIDAFNRDLPYDQFVRLQLAADLLGDDDDLPALGFLALGPYPPNGSRVAERADMWADRVDLVSRGLLGLSVACARCHDHLSEPIGAEDYYAFAGIFASVQHDYVTRGDHTLHIVSDAVLKNLRVFRNGDPEQAGKLAPRRNIRLLSPHPDLDAYQDGSGRRELAAELTAPSNPLLARVMVNRVWGELFGRYLVETPSNFGQSGAPPTHPELLDYLACRFVENGWSVKWLVRELVSSATYRQELSLIHI